jgi:hypothetical protein
VRIRRVARAWKLSASTSLALLLACVTTYVAAPHLFNFDDGPYFSSHYRGDVESLRLISQDKLSRDGVVRFTIEGRALPGDSGSVFVLRTIEGRVVWQERPEESDGPFGPTAVLQERTRATWSGWEVTIKPARQESGVLFLGRRGGFRFFYHSW